MIKKNLGQHFLKDQSIIEKICHSFLAENFDGLVEIGPGPGSLTVHLAQQKKAFYLIEKDVDFKDKLEEIVPAQNILFTDALKFSWQDFLLKKNLQEKKIWLISNLPYNISAPLTLSFLPILEIQAMTLMYQKEVAEKILPTNLRNSMNSLGALMQTYFSIKKLVDVNPGAFFPPPEVESRVLSFERKEKTEIPLNDWKKFETFLRILFQFKRKTLSNCLRTHYNSDQITRALLKEDIDPKTRAESLCLQQVVRLYYNFS